MAIGDPLTTTLPTPGIGGTPGSMWATMLNARETEVEQVLEAGAVTGADIKHGARTTSLPAATAQVKAEAEFYVKATDLANSTTSLADVTDLIAAVDASRTYAFEAFLVWQSAATTTGIKLSVNTPAAVTTLAFAREIMRSGAVSTDGLESEMVLAADGGTVTADVDAANTNRMARLSGVLINGVNAGNLTVRFASEVGASAVTIKTGSWFRVQRIGAPRWVGGSISAGQFWLAGSASDEASYGFPVQVGQRITGASIRGRANGTNTWTWSLWKKDRATGTPTQLGTTQTSGTGATDSILTVSGLTETVVADFEYFGLASANGISIRFYDAAYTVDRP